MAERMCHYGNCRELDNEVTVILRSGVNAERMSFCGTLHACLWFVKRLLTYGRAEQRQEARAAIRNEWEAQP